MSIPEYHHNIITYIRILLWYLISEYSIDNNTTIANNNTTKQNNIPTLILPSLSNVDFVVDFVLADKCVFNDSVFSDILAAGDDIFEGNIVDNNIVDDNIDGDNAAKDDNDIFVLDTAVDEDNCGSEEVCDIEDDIIPVDNIVVDIDLTEITDVLAGAFSDILEETAICVLEVDELINVVGLTRTRRV